jgi:uncharacterized protein
MPTEQYHEPPDELPAEVRTFARLVTSLQEEAEAIGWYQQRIAVEPDAEARAIMVDAQGEEFKHFSMDLEYLLRRTPVWREIAEGVLFQAGDIVEHGEEAEAEATEGGNGDDESASDGGAPSGDGSLGIGSLKGEGL